MIGHTLMILVGGRDRCGVLAAALALAPAWADTACAQFTPEPTDPRARRAERERAVARLGGEEAARRFVEEHGDNAVKAVAACSPDVGRKLADWNADPEGLNRLPRPGDLLLAIADRRKGGDDLAVWAIAHSRDLRDVDAFEATLREPLELALSLKPLSQAAGENRARRLAAESRPAYWPPPPEAERWLYALGGVVGAVAVGWLARRRKAPPPAFDAARGTGPR